MAKRAEQKPKEKPKKSGRRLVLPALLLAILLGFGGWMFLQEKITRLRPAEVYLDDLPAGMEGARVLFISDLNLSGKADSRSAQRLMKRLQELEPDMLLLGGDYTAKKQADTPDYLVEFMEALADFPAPLGKFAVAGENDGDLEEAFARGGVQYLQDACAKVERNGGELIIAGLGDTSRGTTPYTQIGRYFKGNECVLAVAHNPSAYVGVRVAEARSGGAWADLVLSGHTLGGQIKAFGRTMREYPEEEARCLSGWFYTDDLPLLVSQGLNTQSLPLRLGTESEIWLLTLRRPSALPDLR